MPPDGRYAPSPTGPLHLGNLRTALIAWLYARRQGARFLMRIEDLDTGRSRPEWVTRQLADLRALELDWDGDLVHQSARGEAYAEALRRLDGDGLIFECYCTRREVLEAASAPHDHLPEGAYPGTCRTLTAAQRAERVAAGRRPSLRVRGDGAHVAFADRLHGRVEGVVDDFVVRRTDGDVAYNLAVVVDDAFQGVGEVVRGDDLLLTTPRQLWLRTRLGLDPAPSHVHVPLMLGPDGARLAKRHGAVTLADRAALGEDALTVRAELAASIGLAAAGERPSLHDLLARFDADDPPPALRPGG